MIFRASLLLALLSSPAVVAVEDPCPSGMILKDIDLSGYSHGDYIELGEDIGDGITVSVTRAGDRRARIYDTNFVGGADPDLEVGIGNCLIMQQVGTSEPNDNVSGGQMRFKFPQAVFADEITIVDAEAEGTM